MPPTTVNLQVRVPPELAERFRAEATTRGLSLGGLLAELMDGWAALAILGQKQAAERLGGAVHSGSAPPSMQAHAPEHAGGPNLHASVHAPGSILSRVAELERLVAELPPKRTAPPVDKLEAGPAPSLPERREPRKARRVKLTDEQRAELLLVPEDFPRTGHQLRAWRDSHGLGTPPLGEACGVSYQAVQQWERKGDDPLREDVVIKLHRAALQLRLVGEAGNPEG